MTVDVMLRDARPDDINAIWLLNEAAIPNVNGVSKELFVRFLSEACHFRVAIRNSQIIGFLVALPNGIDYASQNYGWFSERFASFCYIDRVVVADSAQGMGIGQKFYAETEQLARTRAPVLLCEVNLSPPNPASLRFHESFGFTRVGTQATEGGTKTVALLAKHLS